MTEMFQPTPKDGWIRDMLCDKCLYRLETDGVMLIADMCARCRKKMLSAIFDFSEKP